MDVSDLRDLDGMLFEFEQDTTVGFWMKGTLLTLDIAFFDTGGGLVDHFTMEPCVRTRVPSIVPQGLTGMRWRCRPGRCRPIRARWCSAPHSEEAVVARVDILFTGYVGNRVAGTVSLIAMVTPSPSSTPAWFPTGRRSSTRWRCCVDPGAVTDVIISHHHPDHTMNIALFPPVRVHDHWAIYENDVWCSRAAEGVAVSPDISLLETPGHTPQDITTLARADDGEGVCLHPSLVASRSLLMTPPRCPLHCNPVGSEFCGSHDHRSRPRGSLSGGGRAAPVGLMGGHIVAIGGGGWDRQPK